MFDRCCRPFPPFVVSGPVAEDPPQPQQRRGGGEGDEVVGELLVQGESIDSKSVQKVKTKNANGGK